VTIGASIGGIPPYVPLPADHHSHGVHVFEHWARLRARLGEDGSARVLAAAGLRCAGQQVVRLDGSAMSDADCQSYARALEASGGRVLVSFMRANFALAGCRAHEP
jgi:hypothetical protein